MVYTQCMAKIDFKLFLALFYKELRYESLEDE